MSGPYIAATCSGEACLAFVRVGFEIRRRILLVLPLQGFQVGQ